MDKSDYLCNSLLHKRITGLNIMDRRKSMRWLCAVFLYLLFYSARAPPFSNRILIKNLIGGKAMKKIKLKDEYPWYTGDEYIEVSDEVAEAFAGFARSEKAHRERVRYHRAFYSLDAGDGIENDIVFVSASPQEIYERKVTQAEIYAAINHLPEKQAKRIYARYFQDMSISQIAKIEGVDESSVRESVSRGLRRIEKILKNS